LAIVGLLIARAPSRCDDDRRFGHVCGHCGHKVESGRMRALIGWQRQVGGVRQPHDPHLDFVHCFASLL
jgi:hypothetical protein